MYKLFLMCMQFNTAWRIGSIMSKRLLSFCSDGAWAQQDCDNEHKRDGMLIKNGHTITICNESSNS